MLDFVYAGFFVAVAVVFIAGAFWASRNKSVDFGKTVGVIGGALVFLLVSFWLGMFGVAGASYELLDNFVIVAYVGFLVAIAVVFVAAVALVKHSKVVAFGKAVPAVTAGLALLFGSFWSALFVVAGL